MNSEQRPGGDQPTDPEPVEGEVVDDDAATAFGSGGTPRSTTPGDDAFGTGFAGRRGGPFGDLPGRGVGPTGFGGPMSMGAAFRMMGDAAPEMRSLLSLPVRLLAVAVGVTAALALLLGTAIDPMTPRMTAFVLAGCGAVAVVLLERGRRRLVAGQPMRRRRVGPIGMVAGSMLVMMLAAAFDVIAALLLLFGVW